MQNLLSDLENLMANSLVCLIKVDGQSGITRGNGPNVKIANATHTVNSSQTIMNIGQFDTLRGTFH